METVCYIVSSLTNIYVGKLNKHKSTHVHVSKEKYAVISVLLHYKTIDIGAELYVLQ